MQQILPNQLMQLLADAPEPAPLLLDVREPWEFDICRVPGSRLLPMRQIPTALDSLDRDQPVVVICHHGIRSQQVARFLDRQGFDSVLNLTGGIERWAQDVEPGMRRY